MSILEAIALAGIGALMFLALWALWDLIEETVRENWKR